MNPSSPEQKVLSNAYRDLLAQFGELTIKKQQISKQIKDIESKLESLNFFAPIAGDIRRELEVKQD